jgi:hypothetical protein
MQDEQIEKLTRLTEQLMTEVGHLRHDARQNGEDISSIRDELAKISGGLAVLVYGQGEHKKKLTVSSTGFQRNLRRVLSTSKPERMILAKRLPASTKG